MRHLQRLGLAASLAACLGVACKSPQGDTPRPPSQPAPALDPAIAKARLQKLRDDTIVERAKVVTAAANHASNASSLRKYQREADEVRLADRVPEAPQLEALRGSVDIALGAVGLAAKDFTAKPRAAPRRKLPATVPEGPRFEPLREDVRGILDVRFTVPGAQTAQLEGALKKLGGMMRLFYVSSVRVTATGWIVEGEAYWFYPDFEVPPTQIRARALDAALREAGIEPRLFEGDAEAQKLLDEVAADYRAIRERLPDFEKSIDQSRALIRFDARMRFVHDRASEAGDRSAAEVLK